MKKNKRFQLLPFLFTLSLFLFISCAPDETALIPVFDCPDLELNFGNECESNDSLLWIVDGNCECQFVVTSDCAYIYAGYNIGDFCCNPNFACGIINMYCECEVDCMDVGYNIGDLCHIDGNEGYYNSDCECVTYDCPELQLNIGDDCISINQEATVNADCECE